MSRGVKLWARSQLDKASRWESRGPRTKKPHAANRAGLGNFEGDSATRRFRCCYMRHTGYSAEIRRATASAGCAIDYGNSGRGSSPTQKARHSLERGLCFFLRLFLRKQEIYAYSHLESPPFSRTRAMQFSRQLRHRKVTKPLDSLDTSKARHSCERGHVDLIFSHATRRKPGKTYADAV